jgi:hypothetical protein
VTKGVVLPSLEFARLVDPRVVLVLASVAYRWPALINASTLDSDAAVVGLQAMHILRGEWSWLLFGSGYQTSVDSVVAAPFFLVLGPTPLALMLSTLAGHILATVLAYATLARHLPRWTAALGTLPLVFTPSPLHTYILGPPRQASLTLVFAAVWLLDGSRSIRDESGTRSALTLAFAGAMIASLACFADPYALLFLPALILLGLLTLRDATFEHVRPIARWGVLVLGTLLGIVPLLALLSSARSVHGEATFTTAVFGHNLRLLTDQCLPWILSTTVYVPAAEAVYVPWRSGVFRIVQLTGGSLLLLGMIFGSWDSSVGSPASRDLGRFGSVVLVVTLGAFLVSPMVMDLFSARYLAAIILMCPFALAPAAARLGCMRFGILLAPYLVSAAAAGWLGFGDRVRGFVPVQLPDAGARDEDQLERLLSDRGIHHGVADYWVAYRLTFIYREAIQVVPFNVQEDRYAPYRLALDRASTVAYVFDALRSRERPDQLTLELASTGRYGPPKEILHVGSLVALLADRR